MRFAGQERDTTRAKASRSLTGIVYHAGLARTLMAPGALKL
jgi:hypothetical protein